MGGELAVLRTREFDKAKEWFLGALLRCYGQAHLVLGDYDPDVERELAQLGAKAGAPTGVWMITSDIDVVRLDCAVLYLGSWHLLTSADAPVAANLVAADRPREPAHLVEIAKANRVTAMVVSDTDDDLWILFLEGLERISL